MKPKKKKPKKSKHTTVRTTLPPDLAERFEQTAARLGISKSDDEASKTVSNRAQFSVELITVVDLLSHINIQAPSLSEMVHWIARLEDTWSGRKVSSVCRPSGSACDLALADAAAAMSGGGSVCRPPGSACDLALADAAAAVSGGEAKLNLSRVVIKSFLIL
jgi:hypothetical protein